MPGAGGMGLAFAATARRGRGRGTQRRVPAASRPQRVGAGRGACLAGKRAKAVQGTPLARAGSTRRPHAPPTRHRPWPLRKPLLGWLCSAGSGAAAGRAGSETHGLRGSDAGSPHASGARGKGAGMRWRGRVYPAPPAAPLPLLPSSASSLRLLFVGPAVGPSRHWAR